MSRYEQIYDIAKGVMDGRVDIELPAISVLVIFVLALMYMVTTSISIDVYSKCSSVKDSKLYDTLFKYMSHTLVIALTIPLTLLLTKMFYNDSGAFMMLYGILGLIVSLAAVDLTRKCNVNDQLKVMWSRFSLGLHTIVLLVGIFLSSKSVA
jgi:hypothetical protein